MRERRNNEMKNPFFGDYSLPMSLGTCLVLVLILVASCMTASSTIGR